MLIVEGITSIVLIRSCCIYNYLLTNKSLTGNYNVECLPKHGMDYGMPMSNIKLLRKMVFVGLKLSNFVGKWLQSLVNDRAIKELRDM